MVSGRCIKTSCTRMVTIYFQHIFHCAIIILKGMTFFNYAADPRMLVKQA